MSHTNLSYLDGNFTTEPEEETLQSWQSGPINASSNSTPRAYNHPQHSPAGGRQLHAHQSLSTSSPTTAQASSPTPYDAQGTPPSGSQAQSGDQHPEPQETFAVLQRAHRGFIDVLWRDVGGGCRAVKKGVRNASIKLMEKLRRRSGQGSGTQQPVPLIPVGQSVSFPQPSSSWPAAQRRVLHPVAVPAQPGISPTIPSRALSMPSPDNGNSSMTCPS
ncbi:hypothetical protein FRB95_003515 [Tulasnella sp. JGI-2019a]|nr:hypothetical protein FRB95_003515 [Tulasnella sp. JGI-2019a]